jgi:hypothetical protein
LLIVAARGTLDIYHPPQKFSLSDEAYMVITGAAPLALTESNMIVS